MEKQIYTAATVEEAIAEGLQSMGVTRDDVEIEVLDEGKKKKGLFGKETPAQVALTLKEKLTDGQRAVKFLEGLLPLISTDAVPTLVSEEEKIVIDLGAESVKGVIGRRGEVIDAIQTLAGAVANIGRRDYKRVVVDCANYREDREETLKHVANKLAQKAVRLGKRVRLEPMNPYERRIIHSALADNEEVTTKSEGKEPARFVVIIPKNMKSGGKGRGKFGDREGRGGRNRGKYGGDRNKVFPKRELPTEETPQSSGTSLHREGTGGYKKGGFSGFFGTYLGNSRENEPSDTADTPETPNED